MSALWRRLSVSLLGFLLAAAVLAGVCGIAQAEPAPVLRAKVKCAGRPSAQDGVREVVIEMLGREGFQVNWSTVDAIQPQDVLEDEPDYPGIRAWIDLSPTMSARLYFCDPRADRFFIRTFPFTYGVDEIAKEGIGHIVASSVLGLSRGSGRALTRSEARAELRAQQSQEPQDLSPGLGSSSLRTAIAASGAAHGFASEVPLAWTLALSVAVARGPRWGRNSGALGAWLDLAYQIPVRYRGSVAGVSIQSMSARGGIHWETELNRMAVFRIGLGGGIDRVTFEPFAVASTIALAPAASFIVPVLCLSGAAEWRITDRIAAVTRIYADLALTNVHYDLRDANGSTTRVLSPLALRPGASLGLAFLF